MSAEPESTPSWEAFKIWYTTYQKRVHVQGSWVDYWDTWQAAANWAEQKK